MSRHAVRATVAVAALSLAAGSCVQTQDDPAAQAIAEAGDTEAQDKSSAQELADLRASAEAGDTSAQFTLGFVYGAGRGVPQEDIEAVILYRKAASQGGVSNTVEELAKILGRDPSEFDLPQPLPAPPNQPQSACSGRTTMLGVLVDSDLIQQGVMSALGEGVPQDDAEAVAWYRKAAEQGYAPAQSNLGFMYDEGKGVPQDDVEAIDWYRKAAEQCSAVAQFNLGVMYTSGEGVLQDDAAAVTWFREAAEQGDAQAQFTLGVMYANDRGRPPNYVEAHMWLNLAVTRSTGAERTRSVTARDKVAERMTLADLSEAQRRAREWHEAHPVS